MSLLLLLRTTATAGLTTYAQFALGGTKYGTGTNEGITQLDWEPGAPLTITHVCYSSTKHPQKFAGRGPATLSGVMQLQATNLLTFLAAVAVETPRAATWVWHDGTEVYNVVGAGKTSVERVTSGIGAAGSSKLVRVSFTFECGDQQLYKAADSSVLYGY